MNKGMRLFLLLCMIGGAFASFSASPAGAEDAYCSMIACDDQGGYGSDCYTQCVCNRNATEWGQECQEACEVTDLHCMAVCRHNANRISDSCDAGEEPVWCSVISGGAFPCFQGN